MSVSETEKRIISLLCSGASTNELLEEIESLSEKQQKNLFGVPELTLKFGVEIEGFSLLRRTEIAGIISKDKKCPMRMVTRGWSPTSSSEETWLITTDGSIRNLPKGFPESKGYEIVSPPLEGQGGLDKLKILLKTIRSGKKMGGTNNIFRTNRSCSIHVHVSTEGMSREEIKKVYCMYQHFEADLDRMLPESRVNNRSRRGGLSFCQSIKDLSFEDACAGDHGKYWSLKVSQNIPTLEFRKHSSSTDHKKISMWILILQQLIQYALENPPIQDMQKSKLKSLSLYDVLHFPALMQYYNDRKRKFDRQKSSE